MVPCPRHGRDGLLIHPVTGSKGRPSGRPVALETAVVIGPDVSEMRSDDQDQVEALLRAAFPGSEEAALERQLRADRWMVSERVMRWQGRIGA
jgi:hypothetical protein